MKEKYVTPLIYRLSLVEDGLLCSSVIELEGFSIDNYDDEGELFF